MAASAAGRRAACAPPPLPRQQRPRLAARAAASALAAVAPDAELVAALAAANRAWLAHGTASPLLDANSGARVVLVGVAPFAPLQQALVSEALALAPALVLLEQPPPPAHARAPHPAWVGAVLDHLAAGGRGDDPAALAALEAALASAGAPGARVGRDWLIDPWETHGFYAGLDLAARPAAAAAVLRAAGFLPGLEFVVAAQHAAAAGAGLACIDAPIALQEAWVGQLLRGFAPPDEQALNAARPLDDLAALERLVSPAAAAWDRQLAGAAAALGAEGGQAGAASVEELLFKVSRATAAALLSPAEAQAAAVRLRRLQPLKWAHFNLRQRYMAAQIKEAAAAAAAAGARPPLAQRLQPEAQPTAGGGSGAAADTPLTVVAVVGRHHVHALQSMWSDPRSALWQTDVPRTFAPSVVERAGGDGASAVESGGGAGEQHAR
ncbi:hypothetical protein HT031_004918 [Scenedesmus sp. PABB004]|nr:hypothetical protein HT031_004918 [Scenedesmus sp. PABB004]